MACATLAAAAPRLAHAQTNTTQFEVVRGRVVSDSARAVANAVVVVTQLSDRRATTTNTDSLGRYSIAWPNGTGEYVVNISADGFGPVSRRVVRNPADSIITVNFQLTNSAAARALGAIVINAQRPTRDRNAGTADAGASEFTTYTQNAARRVAPDQAGDLASIAALGTGIMPVPGGISVLGLGAAQNSVTLNGMSFGGADVPRDAATRVRVTSSSYDPSIGWFSGARTQVDLVPGGLFTTGTSHMTFDSPSVQWTDPVSANLGQRFSNFAASVGGTGQLVNDIWSYNYGLQGGHKTSDYASLFTSGDDLLQHAGISADSAARLSAVLRAAGIPTGASGVPVGRVDDNISFIGRIDHAPYDWKSLQSSKTTWGLTAYAKLARTQGLALGPASTVASAGGSSLGIGSLQGEWSTYFAADHLADIRSSITYSKNAATPYVNLPSGQVLVASAFPDGTGGTADLQFGGNPILRTATQRWTWESIGDLQLYSPGMVMHKVRVTGDVRYDAGSRDDGTNALGTYAFNSLADFQANRPSSFTRTLSSPEQRGAAWNAFAAIGDGWRATQDLLINYGARVEGNIFANAPAYNPSVEQLFGVRTDHAPNSVDLSPRIGFLYNVPNSHGRPFGALRGGLGEFRNLIDPTLLAAPSVSTGLPGGATQLACFGAAAPPPDWALIATNPSAIPAQCASGASSLADAAPQVRVIAPDFTASRSWRANLAWSGTVLAMPFTLEGTASHNLNQRGTRDLNFSGVERFATSDEHRPIFAAAQSIDASSGSVSPVDARRSAAFGSVDESVSDLVSESRQLSLSIRPNVGRFLSTYIGDFIVGYTLASVRDRARGFDQSTFGDPASFDWARGALDARHQFVVQGVIRPLTGWFLVMSGHLQSGTPYTPMIRTDVNGDGLANDRAFVFNPATATDATVATGMRTLLSSTSGGARSCLLAQLGAAAARNSCEGPWSASLNASLHISGEQVLHLPRVDIGIALVNALGGLDQLLHGSNNLRGWGATPAPDPVLLDVRGFDAANNHFLYAVNPRFGATSAATNTIRAPFRLTLDVSIDIAPSQTKQQMTRWLGTSDGAPLSVADLTRRFQRTVPDPYAQIIQQSDSLLLTQGQLLALQNADHRYRTHVDSIWTTLAEFLAPLTDPKAKAAAFRPTDLATDDAWEFTRTSIRHDLGDILTPDQLALLSGIARYLFNAQNPVHIRMYPGG